MKLSRRVMLAGMAGAALCGNGVIPVAEEEEALEPDLPIVDCHHHLRPHPLPQHGYEVHGPADFARTVARSDHRVTDSVFVECGIEYRTDGPEAARSLGETEYVARIARQDWGACRIAAAMVGRVDLSRGAGVRELLEWHAEASDGRLRAIRNSIAWDAWPSLAAMGPRRDLFSDPAFREGLAALAPLGLGFETWLFHPQIGELTALARAFPDTQIILDHLGCPLGIGPYAGQGQQVLRVWTASMAELARSPNVVVKLGGLGPFSGGLKGGSERLAGDWRPYVEGAVALFGVDRCMFESNWPSNAGAGSYGAHWNAFKRITASWSAAEKAALYGGTARRVYRLFAGQ